MPKIAMKRIYKAIRNGNLIPSENIISRYSPAERREISRQVHHIKVSMKLRRLRRSIDF